MGLVPPSRGQVLLDGHDIAGWPPHRVARAGVAYVPEGRLIFPDLTVVENIRVAERKPARRPGRSSGCSSCFRRCASAPATAARSSPAASSRCWRSPARWSPIRRCVLLDEPSQGLAPLVVRELAA